MNTRKGWLVTAAMTLPTIVLNAHPMLTATAVALLLWSLLAYVSIQVSAHRATRKAPHG